MQRAIYLDYNATAPMRPEVVACVKENLSQTGNASSVHGFGRRARASMEAARTEVAEMVNAAPESVIFTSGGTESNNLAVKGCRVASRLIGATEHSSVIVSARNVVVLAVDESGLINLDDLRAALSCSGAPALVSLMLANNETGVISPVAEAAAIAHEYGAVVHCDAVQAAGKMPVDIRALGVDLMSLSAHKLGGPQGVGALIVSENTHLIPRICGGGQERGLRAGTENVAGVAGFGVAARLAKKNIESNAALGALRDKLESGILAISSESRIFGAGQARVANTSCFTMPGVSSETQVMSLDLAGIAVSAGAACSSGRITPSHVLRAMGAGAEEAASAIRVSLGWQTIEEDITRFLESWGSLYMRKAVAA